jgi:hypothetical protein
LLDEWLENASTPGDGPLKSGEWRLNSLRWTVLRTVLAAEIVSPFLAETLCGAQERIAALGLTGPEPLGPGHEVDDFDCGVPKLDHRLREGAGASADGSSGTFAVRTFVVASGGRVAGYYATRLILAMRDGDAAEAPVKLVLVPALAVDKSWRGPHLAQALVGHLMRDALGSDAADAPAAVITSAISPRVVGLFRRCGGRALGNVLHPTGMLVTRAEAAAALKTC